MVTALNEGRIIFLIRATVILLRQRLQRDKQTAATEEDLRHSRNLSRRSFA